MNVHTIVFPNISQYPSFTKKKPGVDMYKSPHVNDLRHLFSQHPTGQQGPFHLLSLPQGFRKKTRRWPWPTPRFRSSAGAREKYDN